MATLEFVAAASHAPGVTGWPDKVAPATRQEMDAAYHELGRRIRASRLDLLIVICNDHGSNFPLDDHPDLAFVLSETHVGPAEWFTNWLNVHTQYSLTGAPEAGRLLFDALRADDVDLRELAGEVLFDDNLTIPTKMMGLAELGVPVLPLMHNTMIPPVPRERFCYDWGRRLRTAVETVLPAGMRVGILATGGMSHEPGGARYMLIDEEFDRRFLALVAAGDPERLLTEATYEAMEAAGAGGTAELQSWLIAAGAAGGGPAETLFYSPILEFRCGIGLVDWNVATTSPLEVAR
ncbi:DODA-type extradiol aromatic ring-opening family dioxygenase [Micromonospora radicis]|uniref:Extradiol ring-cleavage dioxygenase class III enzyme subunit B domain-containing protein n=1 Tax=Micromonospora radicis TaxID=1894971 RepID=A0A418MY26_9ACTN|nr:hypothetical protein [Micromonospora radicis]RIV40021.1 hypothetical protein D2L64_06780 [Micromonospora radicis]